MLKNLKCTAIALVAVSAVCWAELAAAETRVELRIGHASPNQSPIGRSAIKFAEMAQEMSNGSIKIRIFPNGRLGTEPAMVRQVQAGELDMAVVASGRAAIIEPAFSITELPYLWTSHEAAWKVLNGPVGIEFLALLEHHGMKGLAWGARGFRGFLTKRFAINSVNDMKGLKIRTTRNPLYVETITAFGAQPRPMAWSDAYAALKRGTIDGVESGYQWMANGSQYEVAKHLAVSDHIFNSTVHLMNLKMYRSLSQPHRENIMRAARAASETMRDSSKKANKGAIKRMKDHGVIVTYPERESLAARAREVHDNFLRVHSKRKELLAKLLKTATQSIGGGDTCSAAACATGQECCNGECKDSCD